MGGHGIVLYDGSGHQVTRCDFLSNGSARDTHAAIAVYTPCTLVNENVIEGNQCLGLFADDALSTAPVNAVQNWWGSDNGPSGVGPGSGDGVSENIVYEPWLNFSSPDDVDVDGLLDAWENANFGNLDQSGSGDFDWDGWSNLAEQQAGTDPTNYNLYPPVTEFFVGGPGAQDHNLGDAARPLKSLHGAIARVNAIADGDYTIRLPAGVFSVDAVIADVVEPDEAIQIGANVTIIGAGIGLTTLDGSGASNWRDGLIVAATAERVNLSQLKLRHFTRGLTIHSEGGCMSLSDVQIAACETGIELSESYQVALDLGDAAINGCGVGIKVTAGSSNNYISGGEVKLNTGDGIRVERSNQEPGPNRFEGIAVTQNVGHGIILYDGHGHEVIDCTIVGNNTGREANGGIAVYAPCAKVNQNIIADNQCQGLYADDALSTGPLDALNNWWGNDSGPSGVGAGSGDGVSENVFFTPWLGYVEPPPPPPPDIDGDGLEDPWEEHYFGSTDVVNDANGDYDNDGISNIDEQNLGYNPNNPVDVVITVPSENPAQMGGGTTSVMLAGTCSNASDLEIRLNGAYMASFSNTPDDWSTTLPLQTGTNLIEATATQAGGIATATSSVTVVVDNEAPVVTIDTPSVEATYSTSLVALEIGGTAVDSSGIASVTWTRTAEAELAESGIAYGDASWTTTAVPLVAGKDNTVTVTATDPFGNQDSAIITITRVPEVVNQENESSAATAAPEPDPLDIDADEYINDDETVCGSDPHDFGSKPANFAGSRWPTDPMDFNFNPDKVQRDESDQIIGAYLWPDCLNPDDDRDGMPDTWEIQYGLNPLNAADGAADTDGDGDSNLTEYQNGTDPTMPPPTDFDLRVLEGSLDVYDSWLPGYQKVLKIEAVWPQGGNAPPTLVFELKNTSSYPGRAVNDPAPAELAVSNYPGWYQYHGSDFGLSAVDPVVNPGIHSFDQGPISITGVNGVYTIYVQCWDFGARTRLVATHPTDPNISSEKWIPKGSGANGIGSAWIYDSDVVRLESNGDIDSIIFTSSGHYAPLGDDFNNLEEYRGIVYTPTVGGALTHLRLNPFLKDLFLRAIGFNEQYPFAIGNALMDAGIEVHNVTDWGHDATEDHNFFRYHRAGTNIQVVDTTVSGTDTSWSTTWPELEWEFKFDNDPETSWNQIRKWDSATGITLARPYVGGSSGAYTIRKSMPHINVLIVRLDHEKQSYFLNEDGHINFLGASPPHEGDPLGSRYYAWGTKGKARDSENSGSYGIAEVLKVPLDHYFGDKPYEPGTIWNPQTQQWETRAPGDKRLMPLNRSEDPSDTMEYVDGFYELGLGLMIGNLPNGYWDGDRRLSTPTEWDANVDGLSPFDIDGNGYVELPLARDPDADIFANQHDDHGNPYDKARVLKHSITHEICHVLAKTTWHSFDEKDVMYKYSKNWKRDDYLSDEYRELLQIHNLQH